MIDALALLNDLRRQGVTSALEVVEPQADGVGAAYLVDLDELVRARTVLLNHPDISEVRDGPSGLAWSLLFRERSRD